MFLRIIALALLLSAPIGVVAQHHENNHMQCAAGACAMPINSTELEFGTYGYEHGFLHEQGVIPELIERSGKNCCDGGIGGECRATLLRNTGGGWEFKHGQNWCALGDVYVHFDIDFGDMVRRRGITAVVCASEYVENGCPSSSYCAAQDGLPG